MAFAILLKSWVAQTRTLQITIHLQRMTILVITDQVGSTTRLQFQVFCSETLRLMGQLQKNRTGLEHSLPTVFAQA